MLCIYVCMCSVNVCCNVLVASFLKCVCSMLCFGTWCQDFCLLCSEALVNVECQCFLSVSLSIPPDILSVSKQCCI